MSQHHLEYEPILCDASKTISFNIVPFYYLLINFLNFIVQEGLSPINLIVEDKFHRASPGGTGGVKTIGNYASVSLWISTCWNCIVYIEQFHFGYLTAHFVINM